MKVDDLLKSALAGVLTTEEQTATVIKCNAMEEGIRQAAELLANALQNVACCYGKHTGSMLEPCEQSRLTRAKLQAVLDRLEN